MIRIKGKVGQVWVNDAGDRTFTITKIVVEEGARKMYGIDSRFGKENYFTTLTTSGIVCLFSWHILIKQKAIPDMPLDTTLPILQAGHLQDRARKKYRK
jgi:hypothetical protein